MPAADADQSIGVRFYWSKGKMRFQSFFILITTQVFFVAFGQERLGERADTGIRKSCGWAIRVFTLCIVVQDEHHQPCFITRLRPFQHLGIARLQIGSA